MIFINKGTCLQCWGCCESWVESTKPGWLSWRKGGDAGWARGKIPPAVGRAGAGQASAPCALGKACLSPGPSGCPSPSIMAPRELKNGNNTIPGVKKPKFLFPKKLFYFSYASQGQPFSFFLKQQLGVVCQKGIVPWGRGHWTCSGVALELHWGQSAPWGIWNTDSLPALAVTASVGKCACLLSVHRNSQ